MRELPWRIVTALLFPQTCVLCGCWVSNADLSPLCESCLSLLEPFPGRRLCLCCGVPVPGHILEEACICAHCRKSPPPWDWCRGWGGYQGKLRKLIRKYKYDRCRFLSAPLARLMFECWQQLDSVPDFDWIVPVPTHPARRRKRGYDHILLLAKRLSRRTGVPVFKGLIRSRDTAPQFGLDKSERRRNLRGAFRLEDSDRLNGRAVVLVDDVLTTGATAEEICKVLSSKGEVAHVLVLVAARALIRI